MQNSSVLKDPNRMVAQKNILNMQKTFKSQNLVDEIGGYANISALFKNNSIYGSLIKSKRKGIHYLDIEI